jgi:leucyl aminopeptidase (aminopeptidase T)
MRIGFPRRLAGIALGTLALCTVNFTSLPAQGRRGGVNWAELADLVVTRSWKLAPGERAVLVWDQASDRGMAQALREAIARAGGVVAAELTLPSEATERAAANLSPKNQELRRKRREEAWTAVFKNADVAIWLPTQVDPTGDRPFEHAVERSSVRSIHFHWFLPSEGADVSTAEAAYARAIRVAPERLDSIMTKTEARLRGAQVHLTAPNGTDLTFTIPKTAWFHRNTGDASRKKVAKARTVRDREEELPASVLRTTDLIKAEGTLVGNASFDLRSAQLTATLQGGKVVKLESKKNGDEIVKSWLQAKGNKEVPGEFVLSLNPELPALLHSGFMPYYGYGAGIVRIAVGDNWESGGKNRSSNGEMLFFIAHATVAVDGQTIIKDGKIETW